MQNSLWKVALRVGLIALAGAGVISVEPFFRSQLVLAQDTSQDAEQTQTITGRLSEESETLEDGSYYNVHTFEAEAGQSFLIEMVSDEFDSYLLLLDADGNEIARNDDGENGTNAQIAITIPAVGEYSIVANSYSAGETGAYSITIRPTAVEVVQQAETKAEADRLFQQGNQQYRVSQFREALLSWESALQIYREINDRQGEAESLGSLGLVYDSLSDYQTAITYHEQGLAIMREINDRQGEANILGNLGFAYNSLGQYQTAIDYQEQSLAIEREIGDRQGEAYSLGNLGNTYDLLGQYQTAIDYHTQSLAIVREIGDRQGEAACLGNLGLAYSNLSQYQAAIDYQEQSLAVKREIGDRRGEANALSNLGDAYSNLGQYQAAIDYQEQSLSIRREIGDRQGEANSLSGLGIAYDSLGQYQIAIDYQEQSLAIRREIGDRRGEAASLGNLGNTYSRLGQYQTAIDYHQQSLAIRREIGDRQGEDIALGNLGIAYSRLGQHQTAIDYHQQSLTIAREIDDYEGEATSLSNLGSTYHRLGQYQTAIDYQEQSLAVYREIGDRPGEAIALVGLGNAQNNLGQYQSALNYYQQSLSIARELGNRPEEADVLNNLGLTFLLTKQFSDAENALRSAINQLEILRTSDLTDQNKISLFETQRNSYTLLQQVLIAQNKANLALEVAERSRARALIELLTTEVSEQTDEEINATPPSFTEIQHIAQQQNATLVVYSKIFDEFLYTWVIQPTGAIDFVQVPLTSDDTNPSLINPIAQLDGAFYRGAPDATASQVSDLRSALGLDRALGIERLEETDPSTRLRELHQLLIEPIAHLLPANSEDRVIFIPQDSLFLVPFAALQDAEGNYLIERHTIITAPSIQTLALTRNLTANQNSASLSNLSPDDMLIVGNPTMPSAWNPETTEMEQLDPLAGAEQEAQAIAQFLNTDYLTGNSASESQIRQRIESAQLIHFATHGLLEYGEPAASGVRDVPGAIALAPDNTNDGLLTSAELYDLNLNASLVVLSACDTGRGDITGDGVIGLSRALISAGVPSIVVSLWSVPDAPTAELMTEFYRQMEQTPDKAQALRQAMLITMQNHPDPRDWAAFTLIGEAQ